MKVLMFSGGKDSMACLLLLRSQLEEIHVLFGNTGKFYPEHLETVSKAKAMCPHWEEVKTDRDGQWKVNGLPSDVVPIDWTVQGQKLSGKKSVTVQSYLQCCYENISGPLWKRAKELGASVVIRGQRSEEDHRGTAKNGDVCEGITFWHPIEDWSKEEVLSFLKKEMGELPEHFSLEHSSMDCHDCTAYAAYSHDRVQFMKERHPALYADYAGKLALLKGALAAPLAHYGMAHG